MLTRQIRILIALLEHSDIEEVKRLAPWQKTKLKTQAEAFTLHRLLHLHTTLYTIDRERKTGINATPLAESIDFFILHI